MAPKPKATALPSGTTAKLQPFGLVTLARPDRYFVNRDKQGNVNSVNAIKATLPCYVGVFGAINVALTIYANLQPDGSARPRISWPRNTPASPALSTAAIEHVKAACKGWGGYVPAMLAAGLEMRAAATGKTVKGKTDDLPDVVIPVEAEAAETDNAPVVEAELPDVTPDGEAETAELSADEPTA